MKLSGPALVGVGSFVAGFASGLAASALGNVEFEARVSLTDALALSFGAVSAVLIPYALLQLGERRSAWAPQCRMECDAMLERARDIEELIERSQREPLSRAECGRVTEHMRALRRLAESIRERLFAFKGSRVLAEQLLETVDRRIAALREASTDGRFPDDCFTADDTQVRKTKECAGDLREAILQMQVMLTEGG